VSAAVSCQGPSVKHRAGGGVEEEEERRRRSRRRRRGGAGGGHDTHSLNSASLPGIDELLHYRNKSIQCIKLNNVGHILVYIKPYLYSPF